MTRDLYDELGGINNMAVNAFNWIHWEVSDSARRHHQRERGHSCRYPFTAVAPLLVFVR
jgi:hypothetical protein